MSGRGRHVALLAGLAGCLATVAAPADRAPRLLLNTTSSAPIGLYWITPGHYSVGDLVAVRPPPSLASWMATRGYLPANVPLLKFVVAKGGRRVCGRDEGLYLEGVWLAQGKSRDHWGRPLPLFRGCRLIGPDEVLIVNGQTPDSLDSRYFGPIPARGVVGRARPLWIWKARP